MKAFACGSGAVHMCLSLMSGRIETEGLNI